MPDTHLLGNHFTVHWASTSYYTPSCRYQLKSRPSIFLMHLKKIITWHRNSAVEHTCTTHPRKIWFQSLILPAAYLFELSRWYRNRTAKGLRQKLCQSPTPNSSPLSLNSENTEVLLTKLSQIAQIMLQFFKHWANQVLTSIKYTFFFPVNLPEGPLSWNHNMGFLIPSRFQ